LQHAIFVLKQKQPRRTRDEIEADNLAKAQAKVKKEAEWTTKHRNGVKRVAAKENEIWDQDEQSKCNAARPDLVTATYIVMSFEYPNDTTI
jgi:hypothetical protein